MATLGLVFIWGQTQERGARSACVSSGWSQRRGGTCAECALGILICVLGSSPQPS